MRLPDESPVEIIDPFVNFDATGTGYEVPMPRQALRDRESLAAWPSMDVTAHLFKKDAAKEERLRVASDLDAWMENLDRWKISKAQIVVLSTEADELFDRLGEHRARVFISIRVDPHDGMDAVRRIDHLARTYPMVRSVSISPMMLYPLIAPNSREYYPIYSKCCEADLSVFINVGFPGPRVPASAQDPIHLDEVCWFFPDLRVVMRHGGEPWVETCVKMLLRWPNLYYATTGFAPKWYPKPIIDLLNTRGRDKIVWAGYWPMLGYDRLFAEVGQLPIRQDAWPYFLHHNARAAFGLDTGS
jgi:predicted TIM-barrel fold metal-dependent hydrolase